ncbi:MAG: amidohydrolase family protein [Pyrinomonadaceae bacterium]
MPPTTLFKNATIVDGSGDAARVGDVAIRGDIILAADDCAGITADTLVDAGGLVLAPGFIEIHTHYDPQLCWDGFATPALEHGVTTVLVGNCSLGLAPAGPSLSAKITRMFNRIEDLDSAFFEQAVPYAWTTVPEYLEWLRPRLEVNVGINVGHTNLRHSVMGEAAQQRAATPEERERICRALEAAVSCGAFGLSTAYDHIRDESNAPVASALADLEERLALAGTLQRAGRSFYQCNVNPLHPQQRVQQFEELARISREGQVVCSALGIMENPIFPEHWRAEVDMLDGLNAEGTRLYAECQVRPLDMSFSLSGNWIGAYYMANWAPIMVSAPQARTGLFSEPARRAGLVDDIEAFRVVTALITVKSVQHPENGRWVGLTLQQIADAQGVPIGEAMIELALKDELSTVFDWSNVFHADIGAVATMLAHPRVLLGGSDAGAHVSQFCGEGDATHLLSRFVRDAGRFSLEQAVFLLTGNLATRLGIHRRGMVRPGNFADLVLFDPAALERGPETLVRDLPGGGARYKRDARGIHSVYVNGSRVWDGSAYASHRAGRLI